MKNKKIGKVIAVLLAMVVCMTMSISIGFAAENGSAKTGGAVNLLTIGNSTSTGFMLPGSDTSDRGFALENNYLESWSTTDSSKVWTVEKAAASELGRMAEVAYPWQLKKYICDGGTSPEKCNLIPLNINGLRSDDLRAFLDRDYYDKAVAREQKYSEKWDREHGESMHYEGFLRHYMKSYLKAFYDAGIISNEQDYDGAAAYIKEQIRNADVIVLDLSSNNFGSYAGFRIAAAIGFGYPYALPNTYETVDDVDDLPQSVRNAIMNVRKKMMSRFEMLNTAAGQQMMDSFLYGFACCIVNFRAEMEWIMENKKEDAKVITVGLDNPMDGFRLISDGRVLDFGEIAGNMFDIINVYIRAIDPNSDDYYYADISDGCTTVANCVRSAESFEALLADGDQSDGRGAYCINVLCDGFIETFMGGKEAVANTNETLRTAIKEMLYDAAKKEKPLDIEKLTQILTQDGGMDKLKKAISDYLTAKIAGQPAELEDVYWGILNTSVGYLIYNGFGVHVNTTGCLEKYEKVKEAYDSNTTAFDEAMDEAEELMEALRPVMDQLEEVAQAAIKLPEYERIIDELTTAIEKLKKDTADIDFMKRELAELRAQLVKVNMKTSLTYPKGKARVTLKWKTDEKAAGYIFKVNGKKAKFTEKGNNLVYTHNVKIGKKYKYTVKPYVLCDDGEDYSRVYGSTHTRTFTPKVTLAKVTIKNVKAATKAFTVKWKKAAKADGYQIYYKTGSKVKKAAVAGAGKVSKKITKLASKKTYTVKVRAYKKVNGKKYYGKWSKTRKVTVK